MLPLCDTLDSHSGNKYFRYILNNLYLCSASKLNSHRLHLFKCPFFVFFSLYALQFRQQPPPGHLQQQLYLRLSFQHLQ